MIEITEKIIDDQGAMGFKASIPSSALSAEGETSLVAINRLHFKLINEAGLLRERIQEAEKLLRAEHQDNRMGTKP